MSMHNPAPTWRTRLDEGSDPRPILDQIATELCARLEADPKDKRAHLDLIEVRRLRAEAERRAGGDYLAGLDAALAAADAAVATLRTILPLAPRARLNAARALVLLDRPWRSAAARALRDARDVVDSGPGRMMTFFLEDREDQGHDWIRCYTDTIEALRILRRILPHSATVLMLLGEAHHSRGLGLESLRHPAAADFRKSLRAFDAALRRSPLNARAHYRRALLLEDLAKRMAGLGKPCRSLVADAIRSCDRRLALCPGSVDAHATRAGLYLRTCNPQAAVEDMTEAIPRQTSDSTLYSLRGEAYVALGELHRALADFDTAIRLDHPCPLGRSDRAHVRLLLARKEPHDAARHCELALGDLDAVLDGRPWGFPGARLDRATARLMRASVEPRLTDSERRTLAALALEDAAAARRAGLRDAAVCARGIDALAALAVFGRDADAARRLATAYEQAHRMEVDDEGMHVPVARALLDAGLFREAEVALDRASRAGSASSGSFLEDLRSRLLGKAS